MTDTVKQMQSAMAEVDKLNESHGVKVSGDKKYTQVVHRVQVFRKHFGLDYGIDTQVTPFGNGVVVKAYIMKGADVIGSGHAYATTITKEKSLEKLESTAVGRAMASCGLSGGEYATDNEIESWEERYGNISPVSKTGNKELNDWWKDKLRGMKDYSTYANATKENCQKAWDKIQYSDEYANLTEEQQGILNDQFDSTMIQIERKTK